MRTSTVRSVIYLAGGIGLLVAIFAAIEFYEASLRSVCSFSGFLSCSAVDRSGLTTTLGVQDYAWGIGGFVLLLIVAGIAEKRPRDVRPVYLLALVATGAVAFSGYFLYVQLALIHALCVVCATAEVFGGIVWIAAIALAVRTARKRNPPAPGASDRPAPDAPRD